MLCGLFMLNGRAAVFAQARVIYIASTQNSTTPRSPSTEQFENVNIKQQMATRLSILLGRCLGSFLFQLRSICSISLLFLSSFYKFDNINPRSFCTPSYNQPPFLLTPLATIIFSLLPTLTRPSDSAGIAQTNCTREQASVIL